MAIDDYKITNAEVQAAHVQAAPNTLTGTAQENKAVFDGYPELLKEKHNNLIDAIDDALSEKADSSDVEAALAEKVDKIEGKGLSANDYIDADKALVGTITNKVDKEPGKGLSTNDYTTAEKMKLSGIESGAEVNVQADWETNDTNSDAYIKNKPYIPNKTSDLTNDSNYATEAYVENGLDGKVDKETGKGLSANDYTSEEKAKLEDIEAGAEVNVQSDWSQNNSNADDYIKNKPTLPSKTSDLTNDSDYTTKQYVDGKLPIGKASGSIACVKDGADGMPMKSLTATIVPQQSGSGTPSPENIRPISGWESVETSVCGKNLLPPKFYSGIGYNGAVGTVYTLTDITDTFTEADGVFSKSVSAWGGASMVSEALPNGSYRINVALTSSGLRLTGYILDADYKVIRQFDLAGSGTSYSENRTITLSDNETYIALYVASNVSGSISFEQPQIELGTTATAYEPYTATTHTTSLGRTVYGGTVDVVKGTLKAYPYYASYNGETLDGEWICDRAVYSQGTTPPIGSQVVLISGESTTYTLTPQTINTLSGVNNVWADSGDCSIEYVRDIGLALDNLLPDSPTTDGTYTLVCTVSDGKATIAWQSSGASLSSPLSMSSPASLNINTTEGE